MTNRNQTDAKVIHRDHRLTVKDYGVPAGVVMTADIILGVVQRKVIAASPHKCQDYRELDDNGVQRAVESFAFDYLHLSQLELVDCVFDAFVAAWKEEGRYTADYEEVGEWVFQLQDFGENLKKEADQYKGVLGCKA